MLNLSNKNKKIVIKADEVKIFNKTNKLAQLLTGGIFIYM